MTDAITLRRARPDDMERIFLWRNNPFLMRRSTSQQPVTWNEHQAWFTRALNNPDQLIFMVMHGDEPIGQVRFDRNKEHAIISVYVLEEKTGKGMGVEAIRRGSRAAFRQWNLSKVIACIRHDNSHATRAFAKAGYAEYKDDSGLCPPAHFTYSISREDVMALNRFATEHLGSVLVIAAHPDDEVLGCGGTMARLLAEGHDVKIAILGEGMTSRYRTREEADRSLLTNLRDHSRRAADVLGVTDLFLYDLPDNRFDTIPVLDVIKIVEELIRKHAPNTIFTHGSADLNIDHHITHRAVLTATRPIEGHCVRNLYAFEIPSSTDWAFHRMIPSFQPNTFFNIDSTIDHKKRAMACYETEVQSFPHPRSLEALEVVARRWGTVVGCQAAEAFELVRSVVQV
ncbi:MAG TPA: GNAT family N-acetyltransferase [Candidatus Sulfotelmatobacter sp.]|nr:GNAT family N-acetyltransferase [Candidatus Sulfotelmatobacter sp.]